MFDLDHALSIEMAHAIFMNQVNTNWTRPGTLQLKKLIALRTLKYMCILLLCHWSFLFNHVFLCKIMLKYSVCHVNNFGTHNQCFCIPEFKSLTKDSNQVHAWTAQTDLSVTLIITQSSLNVKKSVTTRLPSVYIGNGLDHAEDNVADTQGESTVAGDQLISDGPDQTQGECPEDIGRQPHGRELLPLTAHDD